MMTEGKGKLTQGPISSVKGLVEGYCSSRYGHSQEKVVQFQVFTPLIIAASFLGLQVLLLFGVFPWTDCYVSALVIKLVHVLSGWDPHRPSAQNEDSDTHVLYKLSSFSIAWPHFQLGHHQDSPIEAWILKTPYSSLHCTLLIRACSHSATNTHFIYPSRGLFQGLGQSHCHWLCSLEHLVSSLLMTLLTVTLNCLIFPTSHKHWLL